MIVTLQRLGDNALCPLSLDVTRIGRGADNEIVIEDDTVSTNHAVISVQSHEDQQDYYIKDLDSTNHTYVNNKEVCNHKLSDGDIIRIGNTRFKFSTRSFVPQQDSKHEKTRKINTRSLSSFLFTR